MGKPEEMQFFLTENVSSLLSKLLASLREGLFQIIKTKDGPYCLLLIKKLFEFCKANNLEQELVLLWQELHLTMSKLTSTKRKVDKL